MINCAAVYCLEDARTLFGAPTTVDSDISAGNSLFGHIKKEGEILSGTSPFLYAKNGGFVWVSVILMLWMPLFMTSFRRNG